MLGFGGGPSFIPLIQEEVVENNGWLTTDEFVEALAIGYTLPGPIATKLAAYVGWKISGTTGMVMGVLGTVCPSMFLMILLMTFAIQFKDNPKMQGVLRGIKPAIVAMLAWTVWEIAPKSIHDIPQILVCVVTFIALVLWSMHPAWAIIVAGVVGLIFFSN